jgi:hypothetical protein
MEEWFSLDPVLALTYSSLFHFASYSDGCASVLQAKTKSRRVIFQKAEKYVKEYRSQERNLIRMRRQAKNAGNFFVEPEAKLAFVIRIRGYV